MLTKVQKWGNSLALRLPKALTDEAGVHLDSSVEISVRDHTIVIEPVREKQTYALDDLLAGIKPENLHDECDYGESVGKEGL
ncbi:MAG: AbrB/MazE/SpoVT family DNA-binding domain-containing protein [Desulfuromonadales bacterium]|uniref:AbrB/MazE/SpoVT family DNA-binding domain-containing protein n=1 Tax=Desulfuromonas sp. KJ2020 TaxID=2919173 RepID=UPI000321F837|nr:AbrB/MazE/SpoVT family DNA-binding domain-containing protein [Desulfuromonas sp. KJ2020]MCP3178446.1 AbrB/MazE/SpoVT family DNA-binding domain-containing protein [Desulfuromonas sp. KJ2020]